MPQGTQKPANRILAEMIAGTIEEYEIGANATVAEVIPGSALVHDVYEWAVKEASDEADSIVGVSEVAPNKALTTSQAVGDTILVLKGHFKAQIRLVASGNVAIGDLLVTNNDGSFKKLAVGAIGGQGAVVGKALQASNVTTIAYILAEINTAGFEAAAAS